MRAKPYPPSPHDIDVVWILSYIDKYSIKNLSDFRLGGQLHIPLAQSAIDMFENIVRGHDFGPGGGTGGDRGILDRAVAARPTFSTLARTI